MIHRWLLLSLLFLLMLLLLLLWPLWCTVIFTVTVAVIKYYRCNVMSVIVLLSLLLPLVLPLPLWYITVFARYAEFDRGFTSEDGQVKLREIKARAVGQQLPRTGIEALGGPVRDTSLQVTRCNSNSTTRSQARVNSVFFLLFYVFF